MHSVCCCLQVKDTVSLSYIKEKMARSYFVRHPSRFVILMLVFMFCGLSCIIMREQTRIDNVQYSNFSTSVSNKTVTNLKSYRDSNMGRPSQFDTSDCPKNIRKQFSRAKPPFYPEDGTGINVNVTVELDRTKLDKFCTTSPPLTAILPVYSAVGNFEQRIAIRETIGRTCRALNCKVMFIVGLSGNVTLMGELKQEFDSQADLLVVDFIDTHRDLNNKAVAMLDWLLQYCPDAEYVVHFIDDAWINVRFFLEDMKRIGPSVYGSVAYSPKTSRDQREKKFYVSQDEYPYDTVPIFVVGIAYGFPNMVTKLLRCAVSKAIYIWTEDIWLMGHVRDLAHVPAIQSKRKQERFGRSSQTEGQIHFDRAHEFLFVHSVTASDFYRLHEYYTANELSIKQPVTHHAGN